ncbi:MAG TPA: hypothetical protein EYP17_06330, partial [Candidatus Latescibacteria bacterium]|nr:hypothetical protein [Candidatus Latescibacterota bacterium]
ELKEEMGSVGINWSEYIREAIRKKIELERRREAAKDLLRDLAERRYGVSPGFVNEALRELRAGR